VKTSVSTQFSNTVIAAIQSGGQIQSIPLEVCDTMLHHIVPYFQNSCIDIRYSRPTFAIKLSFKSPLH